jgi:hypothetical protein
MDVTDGTGRYDGLTGTLRYTSQREQVGSGRLTSRLVGRLRF